MKSCLADNLQERLKNLQNEIDNYNSQIKSLVNLEKDYWKQIEQTIARLVKEQKFDILYLFYVNRRTNFHKPTMNKLSTSQTSLNTKPVVVGNATFVMHVDKNNENLPPSSVNKPPKIRKKKK